jgi:hypothetical protein
MSESEDRWLTTVDLAQRLGVCTGTVENWRCSKIGPEWVRLTGKRGPIRYSLKAVLRWETERANQTKVKQ